MISKLLYGENKAQFSGEIVHKEEAKALEGGGMAIDFHLFIPNPDEKKAQTLPMVAFGQSADTINRLSTGSSVVVSAKITAKAFQPDGKEMRLYPRIMATTVGVINEIPF
jgi:hypothetical protein